MDRKASSSRKTSETNIKIDLNIDGKGIYEINSGINFLDHMLESFSKHSLMDLKIEATGDLDVDDHHTIEDIGILLGETFNKAIGDKRGISRMADVIIPMDESVAIVAIDISGRSYCNMDLLFKNEKIGDLTSDNIIHFFESFANSGKINIFGNITGKNDHHKAEALFKGFARSLKEASKIEHDKVPSTKGTL
ncbi:MAG: imidazoleglycerol-phosphate dehydratase HisB [Methanobacteriaceae archaeon]|jgi:imidazoleglycerol-phosphate dehydratase|nr:imidazoleglycerol-phosphate dehydratase HisB [Methanobacteriaceae archaeon]